MKKFILILLVGILSLPAQGQDLPEKEEQLLDTIYPYLLPVYGQKVAERGYEIQLPFGFNLNYTHNDMDLFISEFALNIGSDPNSTLNQLADEYLTLETLNFQKVNATTDGINVRADMWVFPFINVYGLYAMNQGVTGVFLQPEWYDDNGDLIISLPAFGADAKFDATTWGIGTTWVYGYRNYFISVDGNFTKSYSELLDDPAKLVVGSARVGNLIEFKKERKLAVYAGAMWRDFVDRNGNYGSIKLNEVFPDLGNNIYPAIDDRVQANTGQINANNATISTLDPNRPAEAAQIAILEQQNKTLNTKNQALGTLDSGLQTLFASDVEYKIKKEIINNWSIQFGFNFQFTRNWQLRGEFGVANGNRFVLSGLQYRFGL